MDILINNEKIDFTLDGENNCLDVIEGLSCWLRSQNFYISELTLDGKEFFIQEKKKLTHYSLDSVKEIAVIALDKQQMNLKDLDTVAAYFQLYEQAMIEKNTDVMADLGNQYESIKSNLGGLLSMNDYVFDSTLNHLMEKSGILSGTPSHDQKDELIREWGQIQALIQGRRGELSSPETEGIKTVNTLKRLIPRLEETGLLFQTGRDKEALDLIIVLSELLSKSLRILSALAEKGGSPELPEGFIDHLNEILAELANAIESGDTILTGDLAEYEIIPKIEILDTLFYGIMKGESSC